MTIRDQKNLLQIKIYKNLKFINATHMKQWQSHGNLMTLIIHFSMKRYQWVILNRYINPEKNREGGGRRTNFYTIRKLSDASFK